MLSWLTFIAYTCYHGGRLQKFYLSPRFREKKQTRLFRISAASVKKILFIQILESTLTRRHTTSGCRQKRRTRRKRTREGVVELRRGGVVEPPLVFHKRRTLPENRARQQEDEQEARQTHPERRCAGRSDYQPTHVCASKLWRDKERRQTENDSSLQRARTLECQARWIFSSVLWWIIVDH